MSNSILLYFDNVLRIQDLGYHTVKNLYTHPNRRLDWDVFLYVSEGQMEVLEEGREYVIGKGQFLFLKSGLHHWGEPKTQAGTSWYWIHFYNNSPTAEACQELNTYINPCQPLSISNEEYNKYIRLPKQGNIPHQKTIERKLDSMVELFKSSSPFRAITLSVQTVELFLSVFRESIEGFRIGKADHAVHRIMEYLENKVQYSLNSKELEACLHMNYSYLCEVFKMKTGMTIHMYNSQIFTGKAVGMMRNSSRNISEISDLLGFKNPFYFNRVFRRIMGCSPSEYMCRIYRNENR